MHQPSVRRGQTDVALTRQEFERRLRERFYDPAFDTAGTAVDTLIEIAWNAYHQYRKSPRTRKAGSGFADPEFELPVEWLDARDRIIDAQRRQRDPGGPARILLVCGAARTVNAPRLW